MEATDIKSKVNVVENYLEDFNKKNGFVITFCDQDKACRILSMGFSEIRGLSYEDCIDYSILLANYSLYIQKIINRESSLVYFLEESIKKTISNIINQQKAYSYEERYILAVRQDEAAKNFMKEKVHRAMKVSELQFISTRIHNVSELLKKKAEMFRGKYEQVNTRDN